MTYDSPLLPFLLRLGVLDAHRLALFRRWNPLMPEGEDVPPAGTREEAARIIDEMRAYVDASSVSVAVVELSLVGDFLKKSEDADVEAVSVDGYAAPLRARVLLHEEPITRRLRLYIAYEDPNPDMTLPGALVTTASTRYVIDQAEAVYLDDRPLFARCTLRAVAPWSKETTC